MAGRPTTRRKAGGCTGAGSGAAGGRRSDADGRRRQTRRSVGRGAVVACLAIAAAPMGAGTFPLTEAGRPRAVIRIAAGAGDIERAAAEDLQAYIERISGARLALTAEPVGPEQPAILVGATDEGLALAGKWLTEAHLGADGFLIRTYHTTKAMARGHAPNRLVIAGRALGTHYAVFELLHRLGCRFYAPHADGECIPSQATLAVDDISLISRPQFRLRWLWLSYIRTRADFPGAQEQRAAFRRWGIRNGTCFKVGIGARSIDTGHNYMTMVPPKVYFADHPEYYALGPGADDRVLRGGTATPPNPGAPPGRMQLCLSSQAVRRIFIARACRRFRNRRGGSFALSHADTGPEAWCRCRRCKSMDGDGGLAQRQVTFANAVAAAVEKRCPGNYFPFHVEYYLPGKPVADDGTIRIRCHPALVPTFVTRYCPNHGPYDASCPRAAERLWALSAWDRVSSQMIVRSYHMWSLYLPNPETWAIGPRIRFWRDMGARWYQTQIIGRSPDCDLSLYVAARMSWDADRDPDAIIDEFFQRYFGEASAPMAAYYRVLNDAWRGAHWNTSVKFGNHITPATIDRLREALAPAVARAETPAVMRRVERERMALRAYEAMVDIWMVAKRWRIDGVKTPAVAHELRAAVSRMDRLLIEELDPVRVVVPSQCDWWQMVKANWTKQTAEVLEGDR